MIATGAIVELIAVLPCSPTVKLCVVCVPLEASSSASPRPVVAGSIVLWAVSSEVSRMLACVLIFGLLSLNSRSSASVGRCPCSAALDVGVFCLSREVRREGTSVALPVKILAISTLGIGQGS